MNKRKYRGRGWWRQHGHRFWISWHLIVRGLDPSSGIVDMGGFFKLDDSISDHPKILKLPWYAELAHIRALQFANRKETDGDLPDAIVSTFFRGFEKYTQDGIDVLVKHRIWHRNRHGDGYAIHDFIESGLNTPHAKREQARKVKAEAGRLGGLAKAKLANALPADVPADKSRDLYIDTGKSLADSLANVWQAASSVDDGELPPADDRVAETSE